MSANDLKPNSDAKDVSKVYNENTIANLTFKEIMELNKESRKGTFLDRSWKDTATNILENKELTRWQKFTSGGYTVKNVTERAKNTQTRKQLMSQYLSNQFDVIKEIEDEQDVLMLKKA